MRPEFRRAGAPGGHAGNRARGPAAENASGTVAGSPFSRAQILHLMRTEFARARRYKFPLAAILIEADRLRALADVHGRELRTVAQREVERIVRENTRGADHLGMFGEDRFLLMLPHTDSDEALVVAERIRSAVLPLELVVHGQVVRLTLSAGIAATGEDETMFFDTLLSQVEMALEWASDNGGNAAMRFDRQRFLGGAEESVDDNGLRRRAEDRREDQERGDA